MMNKKTKMLVGVAVVAAAAYYFLFRNNKEKKVNASGRSNTPCSFMEGGELVDGKISSYDSNTCISSTGKKGSVYSEHVQEWKSKI